MNRTPQQLQQEQERVLALFNQIHLALLSGKHLAEIYESIGKALVVLFPDYTVSIATLDLVAATESFAFHWENGERKYPEAQAYNRLRQELVSEQDAILVNEGAEKFVAEHLGADYVQRSGIAIPSSFVFAPFIVDHEVRGYISLKHYQLENAFTPIQVKFLQVLSGNISVAIQNAALLASEQKKAKEQSALLESMKDLSRKPDLKKLLDAVLERAVALLGVTGGELAIYHPATGEMEVVASQNLGWVYSGVRLKLGEGAVGTVAQTQQHLLIPDYQTWSGRSNQYEKTHARAVMATPLLLGKQLVGVICAVHLEDNRVFNEEDLALLNLFAPIAATAIDNARLFQAEKQKAEEQEALLKTMQDLSAKLNLNILLQSVVERSVELLKVTGGELAIYHPEENELEIVASHNLGMDSMGLRMQLGEGAMGTAASEKKSILIPDYQNWEGRSNKYQATKVHGVMVVPLLIKDQLVGALCSVHLEADRKFNEDDLRLLNLFAPLAATAIENARLFDKTNRLLSLTEQREKELRHTQEQLVQQEKLASLGELTAGIAHEIQNPLNFVNNFSEVSVDLLQELAAEQAKPLGDQDQGLVQEILKDLQANLEKINHHGKRADGIVKGMLQHSRSSSGSLEPTHINALCEEYLRLAYHGLRAKDNAFNAVLETHFDPSIGTIKVIAQDLGRVVLNLINNAFYAVDEKKKESPVGFEPKVSISTQRVGEQLELRVKDNGKGIPKKIRDKIFQPFFTTKPTGQGTGLGLSLSHDIVKAHGGSLTLESITADEQGSGVLEGTGTSFIIQIPIV